MNSIEDRQYEAWGVAVQTSAVKAGHIANGIVQLLRLLPNVPAPRAADPARSFVSNYVTRVTETLQQRFGAEWRLTDVARGLCVTHSKAGPIDLADTNDSPKFARSALQHLRGRVRGVEGALPRDKHAAIAAALNADGLALESGGHDPTSPGLRFAGYTSTHTLAGMHAATFLGLLSRTARGCHALGGLYALAASETDPQSTLAKTLDLGISATWPALPEAGALRDLYPLPSGRGWPELAEVAGDAAGNVLAWAQLGVPKTETLMAVVDLAALLLLLRLARWSPRAPDRAPLLLMFAPVELEASQHAVVARAQQNLRAALAALDLQAKEDRLVVDTSRPDEEGGTVYLPSRHAQNMGAASGWLYPLGSSGAPKRYLRPGSRQLTTLVHALVAPGTEVAWPEFAVRAQKIGIALGGPNEAATAARLWLTGAASSLREAGMANREHLVALGLARQESDNVVIVDGGLR